MIKALFALLIFASCFATGPSEAIVFVSRGGSDSNDGTSWKRPKATIQAGIDLAAAKPDGDTVRVRYGVYDEKIILKNKVKLLGGFTGVGGTRNWRIYPTTIDANYTGSVVKVAPGSSGNLATSTIDGFVITHGSATYGGGVNVGSNCTLTISNCRISGNTASEQGGGVGADSSIVSTLTLLNCYISENSATSGGGLALSALITLPNAFVAANCLISGNYASIAGGGFYLRRIGANYVNCTIVDNSACSGYGGGIYALFGPTTASNTIFFENRATYGGAVMSEPFGNASFANCCYYDNGDAPFYSPMADITPPDPGSFEAWPMFVAPALEDYHLQWNSATDYSPCIDAGDNAALNPAWKTDLDGKPRFSGTVDIGCYEVP